MSGFVDVSSSVREIFKDFLQNEIGISAENVTDNMRLESDLHLCRLDVASLCVELEDRMFIKFDYWPDSDISVGEFIDKVSQMPPVDAA